MVNLKWFYLFLIIGFSLAIKSPTIKLSNGKEMPVVGFGTHYRKQVEELQAVENAIEVGYRHFDTAYSYKNEENLGAALKNFFNQGGKREEFFVTTKLPTFGMRVADVETYLTASLKNLGLDYIDMYLIHYPFGIVRKDDLDPHFFENGTAEIDPTSDFIAVWKEMEKQVKAGRVKSIGLSNFNKSQVLRVWSTAEIKPTNLQIEGNIYLQQEELRKLCSELDIAVTAYSPLGSNRLNPNSNLSTPLKNTVAEKIAHKYGKTVAQILLRYMVQIGFVIIPNSSNPIRMKENLEIFDFTLEEEDLLELKSLDQHGKIRNFYSKTTFPGSEKHPEYPFTDISPA